MKKHLLSRIVVIGAVFAIMGIAMNAFAADKAPGNASVDTTSAKLTDDQIKQMETERNAFQTATKDLRQQITEKRQALSSELAKQTPDAATATTLQKNISDLQAQYDQKRLTHFFAMKKIDPNFTEDRGAGRGRGRGMKHGMSPGMGQSPSNAKTTN